MEREQSVSTKISEFWKGLHSEIATNVVYFYQLQDVSRQMPGLNFLSATLFY